MKKKKMSVGAALILALLFILFGTGGNDEAKQAASVVETVVQEAAAETDAVEIDLQETVGIEVAEESEADSGDTQISVEESDSAEQLESVEGEAESLTDTSSDEELDASAAIDESDTQASAATTPSAEAESLLDKDGTYTTKEDVALYIHQYGCLPSNFITKKEAQNLGWEGGSLEPYAPGKCIGGSYFGNYEGLLPEKKGREYTECDIDTLGKKSRGAKRIVFSNDGLIYYTEDHYETFELLYGEE